MSYSVDLLDDAGRVVDVVPNDAGGITTLGGNNMAECSITYNFSYFFEKEIDEEEGLRWLHEKTAGNTIPVLEKAVKNLGTETHQDVDSYWVPCPGNAGKDLQTLLEWAREHPEATWRVV